MLILFGIISGIITSLGMGGGAILIILLNMFLNENQHILQSTNLIFFIFTAIISIIINVKKQNINYNIIKKLLIPSILGTILGTVISIKLRSKILKKIFGIFVFIIALFQSYEIYTSNIKLKITHNKEKDIGGR